MMKLSESEIRMCNILKFNEPMTSDDIIKKFYARKERPFNARKIVIGVLRGLTDKVKHNREDYGIMKSPRNGPNSISFWKE